MSLFGLVLFNFFELSAGNGFQQHTRVHDISLSVLSVLREVFHSRPARVSKNDVTFVTMQLFF